MKPCLAYLELMNAVLDGEAAPVQHEALSAHLAQCPACAALYEDLKALREGSDALVTKAPESLKENVMSRITAEAKPTNVVAFPAKNKKKSANRWRSWAAMAAVFALVIGVGTTQDLFGGSSSAPMPIPCAAPSAAAEPAEVSEEILDTSRIAEPKAAEGTDILADVHQYSSSLDAQSIPESKTTGQSASDVTNAPAEAAPSVGPAETAVSNAPVSPSATPAAPDWSVALDMVVYRIYGESGYTMETTYTGNGGICQVRLPDGETVIDEGTITYTGLSENSKFYCFSWSWADQTAEEALLYRYAVPTDLSYVMWAGDTPDMENFNSTLKN